MNYSLYLAQVICLAVLLILTAKSLSRDLVTNFAGTAYVCFWVGAVSIIFWRYGESQDVFYSSDQYHHAVAIYKIRTDGLSLDPSEVLGYRYVISVPAMLLNSVGIHPLLAYKFLQGASVLLLLAIVTEWVRRQIKQVPLWTYALTLSPIVLLNSVLALRDSILNALTAAVVLHPRGSVKLVAAIGILGLRPQMAVALALGFALSKSLVDSGPIMKALWGIGAFLFGRLLFNLASQPSLQGIEAFRLDMISQTSFIRLLATAIGFQFLTVDEFSINLEISQLLFLRLLFYDTWIIPGGFLAAVFIATNQSPGTKSKVTSLYLAFIVYVGIASKTDFTSSRQSMPFFGSMVALSLVTFAGYRKQTNYQKV
jgi:hypothetical protein